MRAKKRGKKDWDRFHSACEAATAPRDVAKACSVMLENTSPNNLDLWDSVLEAIYIYTDGRDWGYGDVGVDWGRATRREVRRRLPELFKRYKVAHIRAALREKKRSEREWEQREQRKNEACKPDFIPAIVSIGCEPSPTTQ